MRAYRQFASVYDRLMEDMPYSDWLRFARESWERYGIPKTVVDLGCGTGSLAIPLARSGFEVFAIDLSADMLTIGRSKWEGSPQQAIRSNCRVDSLAAAGYALMGAARACRYCHFLLRLRELFDGGTGCGGCFSSDL